MAKNSGNKKKFAFSKLFICLFLIIVIVLVSFIIVSNNNLKPVDEDNGEIVQFVVENGTGKYAIADKLEEKGLIRSALFFKFYVRFNSSKDLYAGTYNLSKAMSVQDIIEIFNKNDCIENESVSITFIEGKRLTDYAKKIEEVFEYSSEDVIKVADSEEFVNKMISEYSFITDEVKDKDIYHPLEGYLFPDTYSFKKTATIEEILTKLIATMEKKLEVYSNDIEASKFTVHKLLTLASIVELEGSKSDDRAGVAGVFLNRIEANWSLGSDVTTYYAVNKDFSRDLSVSNLKSCNKYNTSSSSTCAFTGLPIGPIASPSLNSINAVMEPEDHDYYYFVADKNSKTYFSKTYKEHASTVSKLKSEGLWYEY